MKICWIHYVSADLKLNQLPIFCSIVPFTTIIDHPSRSTTRGVLCKKVFLEISQNSQENTCARIFFYESCRLNFVKFVRTSFSQNTYGRLLLSLLSSIRNIGCKFFENTDYSFVQTLNGNSSLDINTNSLILNATTDFILSTKRFEEALF